jgi:hypothetical protein
VEGIRTINLFVPTSSYQLLFYTYFFAGQAIPSRRSTVPNLPISKSSLVWQLIVFSSLLYEGESNKTKKKDKKFSREWANKNRFRFNYIFSLPFGIKVSLHKRLTKTRETVTALLAMAPLTV